MDPDPERMPVAHCGDSTLYCQLVGRATKMPELMWGDEEALYDRLVDAHKITTLQRDRLRATLHHETPGAAKV